MRNSISERRILSLARLESNTVLGQPTGKHIVLHGLLTTGGTLQNVKGPETNPGFMAQLLAAITEWQFRPALRNKKPIEVEILLVIPPRA